MGLVGYSRMLRHYLCAIALHTFAPIAKSDRMVAACFDASEYNPSGADASNS